MPANQGTRLEDNADLIDLSRGAEAYTTLRAAADGFIKTEDGQVKIWAASRDWFLEEWGRDAFIALPGLLLAAKRFDEAKQVFKRFAKLEKHGLIPNVIKQDDAAYNTVDAALWFISALEDYVFASGDWDFGREMKPTVFNIIAGYSAGTGYLYYGTRHDIAMDKEDGLIVSPPQATWMDADPAQDGTSFVTPRAGKCVEVNALWYRALKFAAELAKRADDPKLAEFTQGAELVRQNYARSFWNEDSGCLYDVLTAEGPDASIRPNQLFAVSRGGDLLAPEQKRQVFDVVTDKLLTPGGLRTLAPDHPDYKGQYDTSAPMEIKDLAYHQGTVWPWLMGAYCDALAIVRTSQGDGPEAIKAEIAAAINPLVKFCLDSRFLFSFK